LAEAGQQGQQAAVERGQRQADGFVQGDPAAAIRGRAAAEGGGVRLGGSVGRVSDGGEARRAGRVQGDVEAPVGQDMGELADRVEMVHSHLGDFLQRLTNLVGE
jgi:hypothetical protein